MNKQNGFVLIVAIAVASLLSACSEDRRTERWVTTENTTVPLDWDKVNEAYQQAEGPKDFEKRVNEIYEGEELISVSVMDKSKETQVVTGFFDRNGNGQVEDAEKIFTLNREIAGEKGNVQISGYGPYAGYRSPIWDIATGMLLGSMISNAFRPNYAPAYSRPYVTSSSRLNQIRNDRSSFRKANPSRFQKASGSGRSYGNRGSSFGSGSRSSGSTGRSSSGFGGSSRRSGGGFGISGNKRRKRKHLDA